MDREIIYNLRNTDVIASLSSSVGFTDSKISDDELEKLHYVLIQPQGGAVHYQTSGDAAATNAGIHIGDHAVVEIWGSDAIKNFRCIDDGGSATLSCKFYGS